MTKSGNTYVKFSLYQIRFAKAYLSIGYDLCSCVVIHIKVASACVGDIHFTRKNDQKPL